ncbi:hypothetical protein O3P69_015665, partial [Scylla paramamosain]
RHVTPPLFGLRSVAAPWAWRVGIFQTRPSRRLHPTIISWGRTTPGCGRRRRAARGALKIRCQNPRRESLTVDLAAVHVVTAVGTQGRFGNRGRQEYTEEYMLEYWRPGLDSFRVYTSGYGNN